MIKMCFHFHLRLALLATIAAATPLLQGHTRLNPSHELIASPRALPESERFHLPATLQVTNTSGSVPRSLTFFDLASGEFALPQQTAPDAAPIIGYHAASGRVLTLNRDSKLEVHQEGSEVMQLDLDVLRGVATLLDDGDRIFVSGAISFGTPEEKSLLYSISQDAVLWQELGTFELSPDQSRAVQIKPFSFTTSFNAGASSIKAINATDGSLVSEIDLATPFPTNTLRLVTQSSDQGYLLLHGTLASNPNQPAEQTPSILIVNTSLGTSYEIPNSEQLLPYVQNAFSPSGSIIALWDSVTKSIAVIRSSDGSRLFTRSAAAPSPTFSSDEQTLYLPAQQSGSIEALNAQTGQLKRSYDLPSTETIAALAASPDGSILAAVAGDAAFQIDLQTGAVTSFPLLDILYRGIKFSPDSNYWILSSAASELIAVPTATPSNWRRLTHPPAELLLDAPSEGSLRYISSSNYLAERQLSGSGLSLTRLASEGSNSAQILAHSKTSLLVKRTTRVENGYLEKIHVVAATTGQSQWEPPLGTNGLVASAVGSNGEVVSVIERANPFNVFDSSNRLVAYRKSEDTPLLDLDNSQGNFIAVSISPDGALIVALQISSSSSTRARLFRSSDGGEISLPETPSQNWSQARFGPQSKRLYLLPSSNDLGRKHYQISIINLETNDLEGNLSLYGYVPSSLLDISPNGRYLVALSREQKLILVDLQQGKVADETEISWTANNVFFTNFGPPPEQAIFEENSRSFLFRDTLGSVRRWFLTSYSLVSPRLETRADQRMVTHPRTPDSTYLLECSNNLSDWELKQEYEGSDLPIEFPLTPPSGPEPEFYRLWKSEPQPQ